jgi:SAM-dependent methyltransferase
MTSNLSRPQRWENFFNQRSLLQRYSLKFSTRCLYKIRNDFAEKYIRGKGYEIGAQNSPLICKKSEEIRYIDYLSREESSKKYNIPFHECVDVDIIADANDLSILPNESASFIIANHVLEHSPNPIKALLDWLRILKPGGTLFLSLPHNCSNEFDFEKKLTSLNHLVEDFNKAKKGEDITTVHIQEHVKLIDGISPQNNKGFTKRCEELIKSNLHTHYHVFNKNNCFDLLNHIHSITPITIRNYLTLKNGFELLFIIEKGSDNPNMKLYIGQKKALNSKILFKNFLILSWLKLVSFKP